MGVSEFPWTKSSHSSPEGGNCLEWQPSSTPRAAVRVRDGKNPAGPVLAFPAAAFAGFVAGVKAGGFPGRPTPA